MNDIDPEAVLAQCAETETVNGRRVIDIKRVLAALQSAGFRIVREDNSDTADE